MYTHEGWPKGTKQQQQQQYERSFQDEADKYGLPLMIGNRREDPFSPSAQSETSNKTKYKPRLTAAAGAATKDRQLFIANGLQHGRA